MYTGAEDMSLLKPTEVDFETVWDDQFGLTIDYLLSDNYIHQANIKGMYLYRYLQPSFHILLIKSNQSQFYRLFTGLPNPHFSRAFQSLSLSLSKKIGNYKEVSFYCKLLRLI